jgi:hypothetical protein
MRLVRAARPRWLLIENVPGLLSSNDGLDFASVVAEILGISFDVPEDQMAKLRLCCIRKSVKNSRDFRLATPTYLTETKKQLMVRDTGLLVIRWPFHACLTLANALSLSCLYTVSRN